MVPFFTDLSYNYEITTKIRNRGGYQKTIYWKIGWGKSKINQS